MITSVVRCTANGTRFYLTHEGLASDIPSRAAQYRDFTDATLHAIEACREWAGIYQGSLFLWRPYTRLHNGTEVTA